MATLLKRALGFLGDPKNSTSEVPEAIVQVQQPPPSLSSLPPNLREEESERSPSPADQINSHGRGVGGEGEALCDQSIRYRWVQNLSSQNLTEFAGFTFPNISRRRQRQPQQGPLGSVAAFAHIDQLKEAPWLRKYTLPEQFTVLSWEELTEEERSHLLTHKTYPDSLTPFDPDPRIEPSNSVGLRHNGEVVGWCINHRVASDTIRHSTMFVEEQFQRLGRGFSLLAEAVKRQIEHDIPYASAAVASNTPS